MAEGSHLPIIDLAFPITGVTGDEIPIDHGYALFSALSRQLDEPENPQFHESHVIGVHPIRGQYSRPGHLHLTPKSKVMIRASASMIPWLMKLAGKNLELGGYSVRLGIPRPLALSPTPSLYAHLVTTKNGNDETRFDAEIARQLESLNIKSKPKRGSRRILRIKAKRVVAHGVLVAGLTDHESIALQENGLGGRRKMGCGVFVPYPGEDFKEL